MPREKLSEDIVLDKETTIKVFLTLLNHKRCRFATLYKSVSQDMVDSTLYIHLDMLKNYISHDKKSNEYYINPLKETDIISIVNSKQLAKKLPNLKWQDKIGFSGFDPDKLNYVELIREYSQLRKKLERNAKKMRSIWAGHILFQYTRYLDEITGQIKNKEDRAMVLGYFYYLFKKWTILHEIQNLKHCATFEKHILRLDKANKIKSEVKSWDELDQTMNQKDLRDTIARISYEEGGIPYYIAYEMGIIRGEIKKKSMVTMSLLERQDIMNQLIEYYKIKNMEEGRCILLPLSAPFIAVDCSN